MAITRHDEQLGFNKNLFWDTWWILQLSVWTEFVVGSVDQDVIFWGVCKAYMKSNWTKQQTFEGFFFEEWKAKGHKHIGQHYTLCQSTFIFLFKLWSVKWG